MLETTVLERPYITITNVIWSYDQINDQLQLLLVKRADEPYENYWALPETFMRTQESGETAVLRLIKEKIGLNLSSVHTEQLGTFTNKLRAPDRRVLSLAYMTFLPEMPELKAGYGALDAHWFSFSSHKGRFCLTHGQSRFYTAAEDDEAVYYEHLNALSPQTDLAFDHEWIVKAACQRIKNKLDYQPNILLVLGDTFTLKKARSVFAAFLQLPIDKIDNSNFKKTHQHLFQEVGTSNCRYKGRPAKLYHLSYLIE